MGTHKTGVAWLEKNYDVQNGRIVVSKYYRADESSTKKPAWWLEIPSSVITDEEHEYLHLLCEKESANDFYYLRVPISYLRNNIKYFDFRKNGEVLSLILSAEEYLKFTDVRGKGNVNFSEFLQ